MKCEGEEDDSCGVPAGKGGGVYTFDEVGIFTFFRTVFEVDDAGESYDDACEYEAYDERFC